MSTTYIAKVADNGVINLLKSASEMPDSPRKELLTTQGYSLLAVGNDVVNGDFVCFDSEVSSWVVDTDAQSEAENQDTYKIEYDWAQTQVQANGSVDEGLSKLADGDSRAVGTEALWRVFRMGCRDYTSCLTEDGGTTYTVNDVSSNLYTFEGNEYTLQVDNAGRPVAPS